MGPIILLLFDGSRRWNNQFYGRPAAMFICIEREGVNVLGIRHIDQLIIESVEVGYERDLYEIEDMSGYVAFFWQRNPFFSPGTPTFSPLWLRCSPPYDFNTPISCAASFATASAVP